MAVTMIAALVGREFGFGKRKRFFLSSRGRSKRGERMEIMNEQSKRSKENPSENEINKRRKGWEVSFSKRL